MGPWQQQSNQVNPTRLQKRRNNHPLTIILMLITVVIWNQYHLAARYDPDNAHWNDATSKSSSPSSTLDGSYTTSPICGACYRGGNLAEHCYGFVQRRMIKYNESIVDAAIRVAGEHKVCHLCDPTNCWQRLRNSYMRIQNDGRHPPSKFWRFDMSNPKIINPTTITLPSIPSHHRIPPYRFNDAALFFQERYNYSVEKNAPEAIEIFMEYNPGLVALPPTSKRNLPKQAAYLLSLRVTPANNCFKPEVYAGLPENVWKAIYHTSINHLGLALLDDNYDILPGYDVVIDIDVQLNLTRVAPSLSALGPTFMDYRLFLLNGEIYLHTNADTVSVTKLKLKAKGFEHVHNNLVNDGDSTTDAHNKDPSDDEEGKNFRDFQLTNLFGGDLLEVSIEHQLNTIWSGGIGGKNYALFSIMNTTHPGEGDSIYAEIDITPIHRVQQILPDLYDHISLYRVFEYVWKPKTSKGRNFKIDNMNRRSMKTVGNITESDNAPMPSFFTLDALWYPGKSAPFKESVHGGACCVLFSANDLSSAGMNNTPNESVLVGIAHTKVPWRPWYNRATELEKNLLPHTHYVSLFYAFDPRPPFRLRARSGYFCLGFVPPSSSEHELPQSEGGTFNPHSILTRNRMLRQNNITFDCPQMHFVSSFIQKANDPSSVVIGYGLNDCTPRLVEVKKEEVVRLLFPDPLDMLFEIV